MTFRAILLTTLLSAGIAIPAMAVPTTTTNVWYYFTNYGSGGSGSGSGGTGGDDDTNCKAAGEACSTGDSCCGSNHCINGTCGTCPSGTTYVNGVCKDAATSCDGGTYNSAKDRCEADPICPSNPEDLTLTADGKCVKTMDKSTRLECKNMTVRSLCGPGSDTCCYITASCPNGEGQQAVNFSVHTCCNTSGGSSFNVSDLMEWQTVFTHGSASKPVFGVQCKENGYCEIWFKNWWCASGCSAPAHYWIKTANFNLTTGNETCPYGWTEDGDTCAYSTTPACAKGALIGNKCVWDPE